MGRGDGSTWLVILVCCHVFLITTCLENRVFSEDQVKQYERDGFLFVSDLLDGPSNLGKRLEEAGEIMWNVSQRDQFETFSIVERNLLYRLPQENERALEAFREAALFSKISQGCAELLRLDPENQNLRLLRDVFLGKTIDTESNCDWHVDDQLFWPESYLSPILGINVWIALDAMPAKYQGSMAVAKGSHRAEWRESGKPSITAHVFVASNVSHKLYAIYFE